MLWILILMIHYVHSRPNDTPSINTKHCITMSSAKDREITNILAKFTDFLNRIADEHEDIDIPFINIHIENHSDGESEEKDTQLRVLINDCHDIGAKDDNSNKYVYKKDMTDLSDKNIEAHNIATQELPKNKTLLDIVEDMTKEIEELKGLLNVCNKVKAENKEISENDNKFKANNKNNQFSPHNTNFVNTDEPTKASNKNVTDSVVIEDKDISVTHKNIDDNFKITQDMAMNATNFEIIDQPTMKNVREINDKELGPKSYKNLENSNEVTQKVSPNDTHTEINTSARRNQWKVKFIKVIEKLLDDKISNIQFITDNNDDSDSDVAEKLYTKKPKFSDFRLAFDDEESVSVEHHSNNEYKNKNYFEINEDTVDKEEKHTKMLNNLNQNDEVYDSTEMDNYKKPTSNNDVDCEYDGDEDISKDMKAEQNSLKDVFKPVFALVADSFDNNLGKIAGSGIEDSKNDIEPNKQTEDTIIIVDTYPGIDEFINLDIKDDTEKDYNIKTDVQHDILEVKDDLQNINTVDIIPVNINSEDNENNSHENDKQEASNRIGRNANKININESIAYLNNPNYVNIDSTEHSCDDNREINTNSHPESSILVEYNPIDKGDINKDNDASNETTEELIPNFKQKAPEVLPLSLEENGEEMVQMIEGKRDKSKPLWVYIQEKNEQNKYVFFSKK